MRVLAFHTLADDERRATVTLIAALAELDARRLYLREGFSSLFTYCTQALHLSEHAAYGRIEAARAARRFPILLELLADGALTLTSLCLVAPHLTEDNHRDVLAAARHKTKREVELLIATLRPQPPVPATVRKLPPPRPARALPTPTDESSGAATPDQPSQVKAPVSEAPKPSAIVTPLAPERYKLQLTLSADTHQKLRRAQDLLRHAVPNGDLAVIVDRALTLLVQELERTKFAETARPHGASVPRGRSRHIPAEVRRRVWQRDGGRCAFVGTEGRRCTGRGFLEFHHVMPYADGGPNLVENLELRRRAHNTYEAARWDGTLFAREPRPAPWDSVQDREGRKELLPSGEYRGTMCACVCTSIACRWRHQSRLVARRMPIDDVIREGDAELIQTNPRETCRAILLALRFAAPQREHLNELPLTREVVGQTDRECRVNNARFNPAGRCLAGV